MYPQKQYARIFLKPCLLPGHVIQPTKAVIDLAEFKVVISIVVSPPHMYIAYSGMFGGNSYWGIDTEVIHLHTPGSVLQPKLTKSASSVARYKGGVPMISQKSVVLTCPSGSGMIASVKSKNAVLLKSQLLYPKTHSHHY